MRIVASNSEQELQRTAALTELEASLRNLTGNMLRVCRGSGKPADIFDDLERCLAAFLDYRAITGRDPPDAILKKLLEIAGSDSGPTPEGDVAWLRKQEAERLITRASLQIAASSLLGQSLQLDRAERDLAEALANYVSVGRAAFTEMTIDRGQAPALGRAVTPQNSAAQSDRPPNRDPFEPPPYSSMRSIVLDDATCREFDSRTALDLVLQLNRLWRAEGRRPLPQGQYPQNASTLRFVIKELRLARDRALRAKDDR